jgi:hypothetical protein
VTREEHLVACAYQHQQTALRLQEEIERGAPAAVQAFLHEAHAALEKASQAYVVYAERERHDA